MYSINYERLVIDDVGVRLGFSYAPRPGSFDLLHPPGELISFPITVSYLGIHSGRHALELGGGTTPILTNKKGLGGASQGFHPYATAMIGYRFHPVDGGGFQFRVGVMAFGGAGLGDGLNGGAADFGVLPWGYISLGGSF